MYARNLQMSMPLSKPADFYGHFSTSAGLSFSGRPQLYAIKPADVRKSLR